MSQNNTLSAKAQNIVDNFIKENKHKDSISKTDTMKHVIITLYAQSPNAKPKLVAPFEDCIFNLNDYFTQDEIDTLIAELGQVILYCYEHANRMIGIDLYDDCNDYVEDIISNDSPLNIYKTPRSYIELCKRLSNKWNTKGKVYLPYADVADYPLYNTEAEYFIECKDESYGLDGVLENYTNAYFQILLDSLSIKSKIVYGDSDYSNYRDNFGTRPDYIFVCNPSLNYVHQNNLFVKDKLTRNSQDVEAYELGKNIADWALMAKENGSIDGIFPQDFFDDKDFWNGFNHLKALLETEELWAEGLSDRRETLSKEWDKLSVTVIKLKGLFECENVDPILFHIEKNGEKGGNIRFIDATGDEFYIRNKETFNKDLNVDALMEFINQKEANPKYESRVLYTQLAGGKDNCVKHQYLIDKKLPKLSDGESYISLRALIEVVPSEKIEEGKLPVLATSLLSSKYTDCDIASDNIETERITKEPEMWSGYYPTYSTMAENCIVAGMYNNSLKFGKIAINSKQPIAFKEGITPFHVKKGIVTEDYLLRELGKGYCSMQAQMLCTKYTTGIHQANILESDFFLEIKIAVPSLEEQERRCKEDARKFLEETRKHLSEADRKLLQSAEEFKRDVHMKKHAIGQTLFNLKNWWDLLLKARTEGNGIVDDSKEVGKSHKTQVTDIYANIQMTLEKLQMQVDSFWRADGLLTEDMSLDSFVKTYIKEHPNPLFTYEYSPTLILANNKVLNVTFSKQALIKVFDNIINNACCHGFENQTSDKNIVKIKVLVDKGLPHITISNNGKPIHEKITKEDVFTYGRSSKIGLNHSGIGGYEVRNLMREFGGEVEFTSTPHAEFPVSYELTFKESNKKVEL